MGTALSQPVEVKLVSAPAGSAARNSERASTGAEKRNAELPGHLWSRVFMMLNLPFMVSVLAAFSTRRRHRLKFSERCFHSVQRKIRGRDAEYLQPICGHGSLGQRAT
jgi:hypothetical protein